MNFFKHQDDARKKSAQLVGLLVLAVFVLIVVTTLMLGVFLYFVEGNITSINTQHTSQPSLVTHLSHLMQSKLVIWIAVAVISVVLLGSLYKASQLKGGGDYVAQALGGHLLITDQAEGKQKQLLNVVAEMAIASGMPLPRVYLMPNAGINAFAAGTNTANAVIGITQGCIDALSRNQLQGVIAHEFSHIHHGDMRLNMRLIAVLHGILVIGLIGQALLRGSSANSLRPTTRRKGGAGVIIGAGLVAAGFGGVFFGNMIKAAVSRQREFLADASAVQYTRNPEGIAAALLKIKRSVYGSKLDNEHAPEFSHFFFASGVSTFFGNMFATHPPIDERISRVFQNSLSELQQTVMDEERRQSISDAEKPASDTTNSAASSPSNSLSESGLSQNTTGTAASKAGLDALLSEVGDIHPLALSFSTILLAALPETLSQAAQSGYQARAIAYALLIDQRSEIRDKQFEALSKRAHPATFKELKKVMNEVAQLDEQLRFPLLQLAQPTLISLSQPQQTVFKENLHALIKVDKRFSIREWAVLTYILNGYENEPVPATAKLDTLKEPVKCLLGLASYMNNANDRQASLNAAVQQIWPEDEAQLPSQPSLAALSQSLQTLRSLRPIQKPIVLKALSHCMAFDGEVTITEREVLRTVSAVLDAPMPVCTSEPSSK